MHTVPPAGDNPPQPHRPVLPPPHWVVIDAWLAAHGVPPSQQAHARWAVIDAWEKGLGLPQWPQPL